MNSKNSSSSSSFTTDLFGSINPSASSSSGIFDAIFAPSSSKVLGRDFLLSSGKTEQKEGKLTGKTGSDSDITGQKIHVPLNEDGTPLYGEKVHPCHYSSSIYYGGQDFYSNPKSNQSSSSSVYSSSTFCKKEGEDDSNSVSRGNWWQGSLYY
ncbi:uncharacterized protein LOC124940764 [Impatiens glandulifera]|uniref:uncharacterized protein LOC124940764 n=1 Tax=Impatiens glandulifera TaxID=253017 RepID=UPI001FB13154|nr:uncharacterized protein LOC124940764 [Impatiens glandulifera]